MVSLACSPTRVDVSARTFVRTKEYRLTQFRRAEHPDQRWLSNVLLEHLSEIKRYDHERTADIGTADNEIRLRPEELRRKRLNAVASSISSEAQGCL